MNRIRRLVQFIKQENLHRLLISLIIIIVLTTICLPFFEKDIPLANAFWWTIVTLTTVGYGDIAPVTVGGRIIGILIMFFGIGLLGMFTGAIASSFVERNQKRERGMNSYNFKKHIILCEWNHRAKEILQELRRDNRIEREPVVLIANVEMKPIDDEYLFFIQGNITEESLRKANIYEASTVIVIGDDKLDVNARDAKVVLTTLTIESINPRVYTIVELVDSSNIRHCERAKADEIIVGSEFSSKLLSRAALDHGISKILSELLTSRMGSDLFKIPVPRSLEGRCFIEIFIEMKRTNNCTVLGIQRGRDGIVKSNPPLDFSVEKGDSLIVISEGKHQSYV